MRKQSELFKSTVVEQAVADEFGLKTAPPAANLGDFNGVDPSPGAFAGSLCRGEIGGVAKKHQLLGSEG